MRNKKSVHFLWKVNVFWATSRVQSTFLGIGTKVKTAHGTPSAVSEAHTACPSELVCRAPRAPTWGDGAKGRKGLSVEVLTAGVSEAVDVANAGSVG